jgi:DNA-binding response OmpR family regulator
MTAKILVVEDEAKIRSLLVEELTDEGYHLASAENGEEGLEKFASYRPDLILCDVSMPKMGGFELLKCFRDQHPNLAQTPFIFLTAFGDRGAQIEARKLGVDDFLTKPVDFELLMAAIRNHLEKRKAAGNLHEEELIKLYRNLASDQAGSTEPEDHRPVIASGGRVEMLGLREIKDELGADWDKVAHLVMGLAENVMSKRLPGGCTYLAAGDDGFEICFEGKNEIEASKIIEDIKQNIRESVEGARARGAFVELVSDEALLDGVDSVRSEVFEFEFRPDEIAQASDLTTLVANNLQAASADLANQAADIFRDILETAEAALRRVQSADGRPTKYVMLDIDPDNIRRLGKIRHFICDDRDNVRDLDATRYGLAANYILDNAYDKPAGVLTSVSFSTITNKKYAADFLQMCQAAPGIVKDSVVFVIDEIPPETDQGIIQDAVRSMNAVCRGCFLKVSGPKQNAMNLHGQLVPGLVIDHADFASRVLSHDETTRRFFNGLKSMELDLLVGGVRKKSELARIKKTPIRYFAIAG